MSRATRARTLPFARKLSEHPRELVALAVILDVVVLVVVFVVRGGPWLPSAALLDRSTLHVNLAAVGQQLLELLLCD